MTKKSRPTQFVLNSEDDYQRYQRYDKPTPITHNHKRYHNLCKDPSKKIVLCDGWAGSGKSLTAAYYAAEALKREKVKGIVIMRSLEGLGRNPGAYPGDAYEKNEPKLRQLINYICSFTRMSVESMLYTETLKIIGLYDLQGMDLTGHYMIVTECQTLTAEQMYSVCTRGAEKVILEGDTCHAQLTNHSIKYGKDGLSFLMDTIGDLDFVGRVRMDSEDDIVRQDYMKQIILRMMPALASFGREECLQ